MSLDGAGLRQCVRAACPVWATLNGLPLLVCSAAFGRQTAAAPPASPSRLQLPWKLEPRIVTSIPGYVDPRFPSLYCVRIPSLDAISQIRASAWQGSNRRDDIFMLLVQYPQVSRYGGQHRVTVLGYSSQQNAQRPCCAIVDARFGVLL